MYASLSQKGFDLWSLRISKGAAGEKGPEEYLFLGQQQVFTLFIFSERWRLLPSHYGGRDRELNLTFLQLRLKVHLYTFVHMYICTRLLTLPSHRLLPSTSSSPRLPSCFFCSFFCKIWHGQKQKSKKPYLINVSQFHNKVKYNSLSKLFRSDTYK